MKRGLKPSKVSLTVILVVVLCLGITGVALAAAPGTSTAITSSVEPVPTITLEKVDVIDTDNVEFESESEADDATEVAKSEDATEANEATEPGDAVNEAAEDAALIGTAKISELDAIAAAEQANVGYTFVSNGLENENGTIVYNLTGTKSGTKIEVKVNALNGSIVPEQDGDYEG